MQRRLGRGACAALAALALGCERNPSVTIHAAAGESVTVRVEIADTPEARARGLMYRTDLADDQGMIFLFEKDADRAFWMKNTPLSLDMIFIAVDGRIAGIATDTEPFSLKPVRVGAPSRFVLEVRAGFSKKHGLKPGDRVTFSRISSALAP